MTRVNGVLRGRRGARLTALTAGGTIPDNADYQVLLEPENHFIGTVNEDFAVESLAGDVFQLGNRSYKIQRVERGVVRVEDAHGMAPDHSVLARRGARPHRRAVAVAVSRLRARGRGPPRAATRPAPPRSRWLVGRARRCSRPPPSSSSNTCAPAMLPWAACRRSDTIVLERFFDEAGGMQLVVHSPYGSRINRAWGLALRKRFCRKFNFELQAAATEDNIVISLDRGAQLPARRGRRATCTRPRSRDVLTQALLDSPMFTTRWRWVVGVSLALPRFRGGRKVPPQLARMGAEDLIGAVFPDQIACAENLPGEREIPDHPLVSQAHRRLPDEAMDVEGLERLLKAIEVGRRPRRGARPHAALAAGAGGAVGAALCLSRRRAAGRAPHPGGDGAPLDVARGGIRSRPPRSGGDRAGARRSLAATRRMPTSCTTPWSGSAS